MSWFCKHDWNVLHNEEVKPLALRLIEAGCSLSNARGAYLLKGYTVVVLSCKKCGKVKKIQSEVAE